VPLSLHVAACLTLGPPLLQDMDLEQSNSLSFFAIDRDSDCADNLDLPCMALELEKEVMELEAAR
jgi:hypothetical protein